MTFRPSRRLPLVWGGGEDRPREAVRRLLDQLLAPARFTLDGEGEDRILVLADRDGAAGPWLHLPPASWWRPRGGAGPLGPSLDAVGEIVRFLARSKGDLDGWPERAAERARGFLLLSAVCREAGGAVLEPGEGRPGGARDVLTGLGVLGVALAVLAGLLLLIHPVVFLALLVPLALGAFVVAVVFHLWTASRGPALLVDARGARPAVEDRIDGGEYTLALVRGDDRQEETFPADDALGADLEATEAFRAEVRRLLGAAAT